MKRDLALRSVAPVFEQENALPGPKHRTTALHGDGQMGLRQRATQVSGHIVRPFLVMIVSPAFRSETIEIGFEVASGIGRGILLDQQRCRSVAAEQGKEPFANFGRSNPFGYRGSEIMEPGAARANRERGAGLADHPVCLAGGSMPPPPQREVRNKNARREAGVS